MSLRYYANAPATTLSSSVTALATTIDVASITGLPISYPFILILDRGTASEEVVLVTAGTGTTLTVERGYDSTTAFSHTSDSAVEHGISAIDVREPNQHVNATDNVHGVAGSVVGDTDAQTLTNKDLSDPTNVFPSFATDADLAAHEADTSAHGVAGAVVGTTDSQTLTNKTIDRGSNVISGFPASSFPTTNASGQLASGGKTIPSGAVVGTSDAQTLTNKTLTSPTITSPTITGVREVQTAIKTADETTTDSVVQNDDHLFVTLGVGTWIIDVALFTTAGFSDPDSDLKTTFTFGGSQSNFIAGEVAPDLSITGTSSTSSRMQVATGLGGNLLAGTVSATCIQWIKGSIVVTGSGLLRIQWCKNGGVVANEVSILKGSWMRCERIA